MAKKVRVEIDFDDSGAVSKIRNLDGDLDKAGKTATGMGGSGSAAFLKIGAAIGGATAALAAMKKGFDFIESSIMETAKLQDETAKMARRLGVAVETLSQYRLATTFAGTSQQVLGVGLRTIARNAMDVSRGVGEAKESFAALGVGVVDSEGKLKSTNRLLLDVADKFSRMEDGSRKTALAMEIFGRSGSELIPMLNMGAAGLDDVADRARSLGIVFDEETAAKAEKFDDELAVLGFAFEGLKMQIGNAVIPVLTDLVTGFTENDDAIRQFRDGARTATELVLTFGSAASALGDPLAEVAGVLLRVSGGFLVLKGSLQNDASMVKTGEAILKLGDASDGLGDMLGKMSVKFDEALAAFRAGPSAAESARRPLRGLGDDAGFVAEQMKALADATKKAWLAGRGKPLFDPLDLIPRAAGPGIAGPSGAGTQSLFDAIMSTHGPAPVVNDTALIQALGEGPLESMVKIPSIAPMKTFGAEMGEILGSIADKTGLVGAAFNAAGDAIMEFAMGNMSAGEAAKRATQMMLGMLAKEMMVRAAMHTAMGIAALTPWGAAAYGPAAAQFKAAAMFGVGAALAGSAAHAMGGGSAGGGGGDRGSAFNPVRTQPSTYDTSNFAGRMQGQLLQEVRILNSGFTRLQAVPAGHVVVTGVAQNGGLAPLMTSGDHAAISREVLDSRYA